MEGQPFWYYVAIMLLQAVPPVVGLTAWKQHRSPKLYRLSLLAALGVCGLFIVSQLMGVMGPGMSFIMMALFLNALFLYGLAMVRGWGANTPRMYLPAISFAFPMLAMLSFMAR